ncbi:hypothetical protein HCUR_00021 [Holospora curviuscula]|uniref:Uncharacterized protein n=1 Tax=Holospora curviuscula TaxID=1082868 RepID=A0A2S5RI60_9PROT|nr:hypothetical protein HCUR_00021 [Holospora curviuscula]
MPILALITAGSFAYSSKATELWDKLQYSDEILQQLFFIRNRITLFFLQLFLWAESLFEGKSLLDLKLEL